MDNLTDEELRKIEATLPTRAEFTEAGHPAAPFQAIGSVKILAEAVSEVTGLAHQQLAVAFEGGLALVTDTYGGHCYVLPADLERATSKRRLCPIRSSTGRKLSDLPRNLRPDCCMLHPENIIRVVTVTDGRLTVTHDQA